MKRRGFIATVVAGAAALLTGKMPARRVTTFTVTLPKGPDLDANWLPIEDTDPLGDIQDAIKCDTPS